MYYNLIHDTSTNIGGPGQDLDQCITQLCPVMQKAGCYLDGMAPIISIPDGIKRAISNMKVDGVETLAKV